MLGVGSGETNGSQQDRKDGQTENESSPKDFLLTYL